MAIRLICLLSIGAFLSCQPRNFNNNTSEAKAGAPVKRLASINDVGYGLEGGASIRFEGKDENALSGIAIFANEKDEFSKFQWSYNSDGITIGLKKILSNGSLKPCARGIQIVESSVLVVPAGSDCVTPGRYGLNR